MTRCGSIQLKSIREDEAWKEAEWFSPVLQNPRFTRAHYNNMMQHMDDA